MDRKSWEHKNCNNTPDITIWLDQSFMDDVNNMVKDVLVEYKIEIPETPSEVHKNTKIAIWNILQDSWFTYLYVSMWENEFTDFDNKWEVEFPVEIEFKVFKIDVILLIQKLLKLWAQMKSYQENKNDIYFDFPISSDYKLDNPDNKKSSRLRSKEKFTLKRKISNKELVTLENWKIVLVRKVYEEEWNTKNGDAYKEIMRRYGLLIIEEREKDKDRTAFELNIDNDISNKFNVDIDNYNTFHHYDKNPFYENYLYKMIFEYIASKPFAEIEVKKVEDILEIMPMFWIEDNPTLAWGYRHFIRYIEEELNNLILEESPLIKDIILEHPELLKNIMDLMEESWDKSRDNIIDQELKKLYNMVKAK